MGNGWLDFYPLARLILNRGGQVLDLYNQQVYKGVAPTIMTTVDSSSMTFVTVMKKSIIYEIEGQKYEIAIRKYTPRDCFRLMGDVTMT